jgi:hypothetical protein
MQAKPDMALQPNLAVVLPLFVVALVVGATACMAAPAPHFTYHNLSEYNPELVQSIAK